MDHLAFVQKVFREVFDDDSLCLSRSSSPAEIPDWDSIAQVKIVLAVEDRFGFRFTTDEVSAMRAVGDILDAIARHHGD